MSAQGVLDLFLSKGHEIHPGLSMCQVLEDTGYQLQDADAAVGVPETVGELNNEMFSNAFFRLQLKGVVFLIVFRFFLSKLRKFI